MPELPEVEITRQGLLPELVGRRVSAVHIRYPRLRYIIPPQLPQLLVGRRLQDIVRRGKYLLFDFSGSAPPGWLLLHLGMSGSLRVQPLTTDYALHVHFEIQFLAEKKQAACALRLRDPRRFGVIDWIGQRRAQHPLLDTLGIEPLSHEFTGARLHALLQKRHAPVKSVLMDAHSVVGIGNIYAAESLFRARISPFAPAVTLSLDQCERLVLCVQQTLNEAMTAGGSSLRDFVSSDGASGYFQLQCAVYGRAGAPCRRCGSLVQSLRQAGRSTFFCPECQPNLVKTCSTSAKATVV